MLRDSWEGRKERLFLFSWKGPNPRNTVEHIRWEVSHSDFFGKGERQKQNQHWPNFLSKAGTGMREPVRIILPSWHPGMHLTPKRPPCACQPVAVKETENRSSGGQGCQEQLKAQRGSPYCMALEAVGTSLALPSLCAANCHPAQDTGTPGRQNPQKTPSQFSWQVLCESSCPLKTLLGL